MYLQRKIYNMVVGDMVIGRNFAMTNVINPNLADQLEYPQNVYGRNI